MQRLPKMLVLFFPFRRQLALEAREEFIKKESYEDYVTRLKRTIQSIPVDVIDRTIDSLPGRVEMVIKSKGHRIKY